MPQLTYVSQEDGEQIIIPLPPEEGFTTRVAIYVSASEWRDVIKQYWSFQGHREISSEGDHVVFHRDGLKNMKLVCLFRKPRPLPKRVEGWPTQQGSSSVFSQARDKKLPDLAGHYLLLHRSRRNWIAIAEQKTALRIDYSRVPALKIIRDGMQLEFGEVSFCFEEVQVEKITTKSKSNLKKKGCPFCRCNFEENDDVIQCPSCNTAHHEDCWNAYSGQCSGSSGCRYRGKIDEGKEVS